MISSRLYVGEPNGAASVIDLRLSRFGWPVRGSLVEGSCINSSVLCEELARWQRDPIGECCCRTPSIRRTESRAGLAFQR